MLNQVLIVGRVKERLYNGFVLKAQDPRKTDKKYDIEITIDSDKLYDNAKDFLITDALVGVRGYIKVDNGIIQIVCDKLTTLSRPTEGGERDE